MTITICMRHRNSSTPVEIAPHKTLAKVLVLIGYPRAGHEYWRAWINDKQVPLSTPVGALEQPRVTITHVAAGL
jgi:hypothetical protein